MISPSYIYKEGILKPPTLCHSFCVRWTERGLPSSLSRLKSNISADTAEKASKHPSDDPFFCLSCFPAHIMGNPNTEFINMTSLNDDTQPTQGFSTGGGEEKGEGGAF